MPNSLINKSDFFAAITGQPIDWECPGVGLIRVRGLNTLEFNQIRNKTNDSIALMIETVAIGMVDPKLDPSDVELLWQSKPGPLQKISDKVAVLSGIQDEDGELEKKVGSGS